MAVLHDATNLTTRSHHAPLADGSHAGQEVVCCIQYYSYKGDGTADLEPGARITFFAFWKDNDQVSLGEVIESSMMPLCFATLPLRSYTYAKLEDLYFIRLESPREFACQKPLYVEHYPEMSMVGDPNRATFAPRLFSLGITRCLSLHISEPFSRLLKDVFAPYIGFAVVVGKGAYRPPQLPGTSRWQAQELGKHLYGARLLFSEPCGATTAESGKKRGKINGKDK